ncbi:hypothetical protein RIF29_22734 [Crotalaria pallida]|uniref:Uncharacterized protein n=1 Tax=Crotalaria pallida TaxID=3830 RepID=A0AAN9F9N3_CROPI
MRKKTCNEVFAILEIFQRSGQCWRILWQHPNNSFAHKIGHDRNNILTSPRVKSRHLGIEHEKNKHSNKIKASNYGANKAEVCLMRRTSSLNESLDRYTQLFEKSFSKDAKWLTNEDKSHKSGTAPEFSRSNFSLPSHN